MSTSDQENRPAEVVAGQVVGGKWRVGALIGRGGMGAVYEGTNTSIGKKVALKFIDAEFARNVDIASRFQREAESASLVESAHIVHIFDSGTTDTGLPYIVMELLRGEDLRGRINRLGRLPKEEAVHIVAQTLRGLHRAHEAGIVHRDLKPDNIFLVDRDDDALFAKIVDFGISKMMRRSGDAAANPGTLTRQGVVLGTPFYMSPEQAQAFSDLDLRTDLWSVGAILFECLGGKPPHSGDAYEQIIISICTTDAPDIRSLDPNVPAALAEFVARALRRDRASRFQTAKEMLDALQATGVTPVRTIGEFQSGQGAPASVTAGSGANNAVQAQSAPSAPTRVSWTAGGVPAAGGDAESAALDDARGARAKGVRRRGLVILGVVVMAAAFLLTFGLLGARGSGTAPGASGEGASSGAAAKPPAPGLATTTPGISSVDPGAPAATASAEPRAGKESPNAVTKPPPGSAKLRRAGTTPPSVATTGTAATSPPPAATASTRAGVAGGLQIKTSYP